MHIAALPPARTLAGAAISAIALALTSALPASADVSVRTTETGTLVQVVSDDFEHGRAGYGYGLEKQDRSFVSVDGVSPAEAKGLVGRTVRVTGKALGRDRVAADRIVAAADATGTSTTSTTSTTTGLAGSYRRVAVVLVNFADSPTEPVTAAQVHNTMFDSALSVDAYYQDVSDGRLGVTGDVFGWFTVSRSSTTTCDYATWGNAAKAAATDAGVDLSAYQSVVYYWPTQSGCSWAGLGQLPGDTVWVNGYNTLRVLGHELGHNLGEHHAQAEQCSVNGSPVSFPGGGVSCSVVEYGDPFTIMGGSSYYLQTNAARSHYGYITPVTTIAGAGGTYTLVPADSTAGGTRMVRIPRGDGSYLSLEFRRPTGSFDMFSSTAPVATGVTIRIDWGTGTRQTTLVDAVPGTASYSDAPLLAGRSVTDPVSGATITTTSTSDEGASVAVSYGDAGSSTGTTTPPADTTAPTSVTDLYAAASGTPSVSLSWGAASDDVGVTGYRVSRNGAVVSTVTGTSFLDTTVSAGATYTYSVNAVDAAGNVGPAAGVSVTVPSGSRPTTDTTAPTAVTNLRATVNKRGQVALSWDAASDDVEVVGYTLSRSGLTKSLTTTAYTDKPRRGTVTYTVVAEDAAGNTSAPVSLTVTV